MSKVEERRLRDAENGLRGESLEDVADAIRALQSTDTPGTEQLQADLWARYRQLEAEAEKAKSTEGT